MNNSTTLWVESFCCSSGWNADGIAAVIAASVAGAASLCVDADADGLRQGLRSGFIDFVVGNLDEALRILKNELRRGLPVSVGLAVNAGGPALLR